MEKTNNHIGITLQEFLVKKSHVDRQFINEFIEIQNTDIMQEHYPFIINIELIIKWLQITRKNNLKKTLKKSYVKHEDYIVLLPREQHDRKHGGHNKETILVTVYCFKNICFNTKSAMSGKIAHYYIALEGLVTEYQKLIVKALLEENKLLKHDLNSEVFPLGGIVYIIDLQNGYFKIGVTSDLNKRVKVYTTGKIHKEKIAFWMETKTKKSLEGCVKSVLLRFALNEKREIFMVPMEDIIETIQRCTRSIMAVSCSICEEEITTKILWDI